MAEDDEGTLAALLPVELGAVRPEEPRHARSRQEARHALGHADGLLVALHLDRTADRSVAAGP